MKQVILRPQTFKVILFSIFAIALAAFFLCPNLDNILRDFSVVMTAQQSSGGRIGIGSGRVGGRTKESELADTIFFVFSLTLVAFGLVSPWSFYILFWLSACFFVYYILYIIFYLSLKDFLFLLALALAAWLCRLFLGRFPRFFSAVCQFVEDMSDILFRNRRFQSSSDSGGCLFAPLVFVLFGSFIAFCSEVLFAQKLVLLLPLLHLAVWAKTEPIYEETAAQKGFDAEAAAQCGLPMWLEAVRADIADSLERINLLFPGVLRFNRDVCKPGKEHFSLIHSSYQMRRSLTSLQKLKERDPNFDEEVFLERMKTAFVMYQDAYFNQDIASVQLFLSDGLFERVKGIIEEQVNAGVKYGHGDFEDIDMQIDYFFSDENFDEIQVLVQGKTARIKLNDEKALSEAENEFIRFCEFWSFIRRPSAKTLKKPGLIEGSCPNCGNRLKIGQTTVCPVCGSFIRSGHYDWVLCNIIKSCEWAYTDPNSIPGWVELRRQDPLFNVYQIEDLAGVFFMKMRLAERLKQPELVYRFTKPEFYEKLSRRLKPNQTVYKHYENIEIASIRLKAVSFWPETVKLYVLVIFSAAEVVESPAQKSLNTKTAKQIRDVIVFSRGAKQKTSQNNTLSSAHCPNCGGSLKSAYASKCEYCGSSLVSDKDWHAERIIKESAPEYLDVMHKKSKLVSAHFKESEVLAKKLAVRMIIKALGQVVSANACNDKNKIEGIKSIAKQFNLSEDEVKEILALPADAQSQSQYQAAMPISERRELLKQAVSAALANGVISEAEQEALGRLCEQFGLASFNLTHFINKENQKIQKAKLREKRQLEVLSGREIVAVMSKIMISDGKIAEQEKKLLFDIAKKYNMSNKTLNEIIKSVANGDYPVFKPENSAQKQMFMKSAAGMAYADGVLEPKEEELLNKIAKDLDYTPIDLKQILRRAQLDSQQLKG